MVIIVYDSCFADVRKAFVYLLGGALLGALLTHNKPTPLEFQVVTPFAAGALDLLGNGPAGNLPFVILQLDASGLIDEALVHQTVQAYRAKFDGHEPGLVYGKALYGINVLTNTTTLETGAKIEKGAGDELHTMISYAHTDARWEFRPQHVGPFAKWRRQDADHRDHHAKARLRLSCPCASL